MIQSSIENFQPEQVLNNEQKPIVSTSAQVSANAMLAVRALCYYSFDSIGKMRRSKPALTVIYENESWIPERSYKTLRAAYSFFHERRQTQQEFSCAAGVARSFSLFTYFFKDFESTDVLCEQVIKDDLYLQSNEHEAEKFRAAFYKELEKYGYVKKSKNKSKLVLSV